MVFLSVVQLFRPRDGSTPGPQATLNRPERFGRWSAGTGGTTCGDGEFAEFSLDILVSTGILNGKSGRGKCPPRWLDPILSSPQTLLNDPCLAAHEAGYL